MEIHLLKPNAPVFCFEICPYLWETSVWGAPVAFARSPFYLHERFNHIKGGAVGGWGGGAAAHSTPGRVKAAGVCHSGGFYAVNHPMKG